MLLLVLLRGQVVGPVVPRDDRNRSAARRIKTTNDERCSIMFFGRGAAGAGGAAVKTSGGDDRADDDDRELFEFTIVRFCHLVLLNYFSYFVINEFFLVVFSQSVHSIVVSTSCRPSTKKNVVACCAVPTAAELPSRRLLDQLRRLWQSTCLACRPPIPAPSPPPGACARSLHFFVRAQSPRVFSIMVPPEPAQTSPCSHSIAVVTSSPPFVA